MKRRLLNLLTAGSLLLFVAVVGLWVRSYWHADEWSLACGRRYFVRSEGGRLGAGDETRFVEGGREEVQTRDGSFQVTNLVPAPYADAWSFSAARHDRHADLPPAGAATTDRAQVKGGRYELYRARTRTLPHAALAAAFAVPAAARAAAWLVAFVRFCHRRSRGLCHR